MKTKLKKDQPISEKEIWEILLEKERPISAKVIWPILADRVKQHLLDQKITNAAELESVIKDLKTKGLADVSKLLIAAGRDKKVKVLNYNRGSEQVETVNFNRDDSSQDEFGPLYSLHLKGSADPFLMIQLAERHWLNLNFIFVGHGKTKIIKVVDESAIVLYENY